jgi:hypothetical protein
MASGLLHRQNCQFCRVAPSADTRISFPPALLPAKRLFSVVKYPILEGATPRYCCKALQFNNCIGNRLNPFNIVFNRTSRFLPSLNARTRWRDRQLSPEDYNLKKASVRLLHCQRRNLLAGKAFLGWAGDGMLFLHFADGARGPIGWDVRLGRQAT